MIHAGSGIRSVDLGRRFRFMHEDTRDGRTEDVLSDQMRTTSEDGYGTDVTS